ncbi:MAG: hypothetical protein Q8M76_17555, partial [Spirochaetaceae bacterium]|nr:hypothetical protein [Spirochaetaceae bacterium]
SPVEYGEMMNLFVDILLLPIIFLVLRHKILPRANFVLAATLLIVLSHLATILENIAFPALFDSMEQLSILAAGIFFLFAIAREALNFGDPGGRRP